MSYHKVLKLKKFAQMYLRKRIGKLTKSLTKCMHTKLLSLIHCILGTFFSKLSKSLRALYVYFSAPKTVTSPKVSRVGGGRVFLKLSSASEIFGPLSHYELVVVPEENATKGPQDFTLEEVKSLKHFNHL